MKHVCLILLGLFLFGAFSNGLKADYEEVSTNVWPLWVKRKGWNDYEDTRYLGPLMEATRNRRREDYVAIRPFMIQFKGPVTSEFHFLYPFWNYYGASYGSRFDIFNIIRINHVYDGSRLINVFPIIWYRNTDNPNTSYSGIFPIKGNIRNEFWHEQIKWFLFPVYLSLEKDGATRRMLPWPFIQWLRGKDAHGFAIWPLFGSMVKEDKYDRQYFLWPLIFDYKDHRASGEWMHSKGFLPFYWKRESDSKLGVTYLWPFFGYTEEYDPIYHEKRYFWPFWVMGNDEEGVRWEKRVMPFYMDCREKGRTKKWVAWPFYRNLQWEDQGVDRDRTQFLYFLYWSETQHFTDRPEHPPAKKTHVWPFYSYWNNGEGRRQFQLFSPLDVFFQNDKVVRGVYSPLFAIYRSDKSEALDERHYSILFDLFVFERNPKGLRTRIGPLISTSNREGEKKFLILGGLLGYQHDQGVKKIRFLWFKF